MPQSSRPSVPFPTDYSICPVCNLDHRHDVPRLSQEERASVLRSHTSEGRVVPYELHVALTSPRGDEP